MHDMYQEHLLSHAQAPRNKAALVGIVPLHAANPSCGDVIDLFVEFADERVRRVTFLGEGCAISQASASLFTDFLVGKTTTELGSLTLDDMVKLLGVPLGPMRLSCAGLPLKALRLLWKKD